MLADPKQPLTLADGRLVYPDGSIVDPKVERERLVEIPTNREATKLVVATRRKLVDLPDVPKTMNTVSVILSYSLFGLDNQEIALATGLTESQVGQVKMHEAYTQMHSSVVESILNAETDEVRSLFLQQSRNAVNKLIDTLNSPKASDANKIVIAKDILDRAGHRPADVVEHRHKMEGGLTIEIIRKEDKAIPTIDLALDTSDDN